MHANHTQPHYAPSSVGGLMDPSFLRDAMLDADGGRHESACAASLWLRWQAAVIAVTALFKRH